MRTDSEAQWSVVEPYLVNHGEGVADAIIDQLRDGDRELAKAILKHKGYLGPLSLIEIAIVLSRLIPEK